MSYYDSGRSAPHLIDHAHPPPMYHPKPVPFAARPPFTSSYSSPACTLPTLRSVQSTSPPGMNSTSLSCSPSSPPSPSHSHSSASSMSFAHHHPSHPAHPSHPSQHAHAHPFAHTHAHAHAHHMRPSASAGGKPRSSSKNGLGGGAGSGSGSGSKKMSSTTGKHKSVQVSLEVKVERSRGFHAFFVPLARSMPPAPPSSPVFGQSANVLQVQQEDGHGQQDAGKRGEERWVEDVVMDVDN